jgi:hypothetical protein
VSREEEWKLKLEEFKANLKDIAAMTPEQRARMRRTMLNAEDARTFAAEMVPEGQYEEAETAARREVWAFIAVLPNDWARLPEGHRQDLIRRIAAKHGRPIEWVREVLNLAAAR